MKKAGKILSVLMVLLVAFTFASCGTKIETFEDVEVGTSSLSAVKEAYPDGEYDEEYESYDLSTYNKNDDFIKETEFWFDDDVLYSIDQWYGVSSAKEFDKAVKTIEDVYGITLAEQELTDLDKKLDVVRELEGSNDKLSIEFLAWDDGEDFSYKYSIDKKSF